MVAENFGYTTPVHQDVDRKNLHYTLILRMMLIELAASASIMILQKLSIKDYVTSVKK